MRAASALDDQNPYISELGLSRASVDFCEANFRTLPWIAEPFNTFSALPLILLGFWGMVRCLRAGNSEGFAALFGLLLLVGLGTITLHATLTTIGQAFDEVPMLLLAVGFVACIEKGQGRQHVALPTVLASIITVVWYFLFQHLYVVFLLSYSCIVAYIVIRLGVLAFGGSSSLRQRNVIRPLFCLAITSYVLLGFLAWTTDMLLCDSVSEFLFGGLFLHPLWHLAAALGTWFALYAAIASRSSKDDLALTELSWVLGGILPCVDHGRLRRRPSKFA